MKTLASLAFLLGLCVPAYADSYIFAAMSNRAVTYLDVQSIAPGPNANQFYATTVLIYRTQASYPPPVGLIRFSVTQELYDCGTGSQTPIEIAVYDDQGVKRDTAGAPDDVPAVTPPKGTMGATTVDMICGGGWKTGTAKPIDGLMPTVIAGLALFPRLEDTGGQKSAD